MTDEQRNAYLNDPWRCPYCQSSDLSADAFKEDHNVVWRRVSCDSCRRSWVDVYSLIDVETVE